ncbi:MAG: TetR/AcrR family transcriptional regulator [Rhodocyclaceae bacterium]|jgi:AcrR family transcriptional regulator|nr:TetR/AcrR family transcriptional regulator [Rhodocyclaceae bacterium]
MRQRPRAKRWHGQIPATPADARVRLLEAAMACFARIGVARTTVEDIAVAAGVHRTTVYEYFANRDAVLAAVFLHEAKGIMAEVAHHLRETPFLQGLVTAISAGVALTRRSPNVEFLLGIESQGQAVRTAITSMAGWSQVVGARLAEPISAAIKRGEVRDDVPLQDLLAWVLRVAVSVTAEPTENVEQTLSWFLIPALSPPTAPARKAGPEPLAR